MRKLYRKNTVHPSPPASSDPLAFLPAAIFTLTAALTPEDKEVLAYLLGSCSTSNICRSDRKGRSFSDHSVVFSCCCFRCYMSYWIRWDSSPNRQLIHEIIDAFEEHSLLEIETSDKGSGKKSRSRRRKGKTLRLTELIRPEFNSVNEAQITRVGDVDDDRSINGCQDDENGVFSDDGLEFDKDSVKKFVSFIGDRIWGVLGGRER